MANGFPFARSRHRPAYPAFHILGRIHARRNILFPLLLVLAGATVYANSLQGVFVFDDSQHIADNPAIRKFWPPGAPGCTRPLLTISLALNYALGGLDVTGYHVFNIAVHLCAGLALFELLRRTLRLPSLGDRFANSADKIAFAAASCGSSIRCKPRR